MSVSPRGRVLSDWGEDDSEAAILHVDMDSFFASVEIARNPELRGRAVIVGGKGNRGVVTSATYEARAAGVRAGMPIGQARGLAPEAVVLPGRHELYSEASGQVMGVLSRFTPQVEPVSIDEAFLDVSGARRRLGSPVAIARMIRVAVREETGLPCSVGVASVKSVAKIASAHAKPDGLLLVPRGRTTDFLHPLPIGALWGVGRKTGEILIARGVETIGDLAHTPVNDLGRWLGRGQAAHLHELAWGVDRRVVAPRPKEKSISTERTFEVDVRESAALEKFLLSAGHTCAERLRRAEMVAWSVTLKLRDGAFRTTTQSRTLHVPTDTGKEVAETAIALFRSKPMPAAGVRLAGVAVSGLVSSEQGIPMPLDGQARARSAEVAMDAAKRRFGFEALRPATLLDGNAENMGPQ